MESVARSLGAPDDGRGSKSERVVARVSPDVKRVLERGALATGSNLSDFLVRSAMQAALEAIEGIERLRLADEDREVFMAAISDPPEPNEALKAAVERYKKVSG